MYIYILAVVTKWHKIVRNSLPSAPLCVRRSEKNRQAAEGESCKFCS